MATRSKKELTPAQSRAFEARSDDAETQAMVYEGASVRQLSIMFTMDHKTVQQKLAGIVPSGSRRGTAIYNVGEAAQRLVKPSYEIERVLMNMNHSDLPPMLQNAFWSSQEKRAKYEEMMGNLWPTQKIVRLVSALFNSIRMILLLLPDTLERESSLTKEQKAVVRRVVEQALVEGRKKIVKEFKSYGGDRPQHDPKSGPSGPLTVSGREPVVGGRSEVPAAPEEPDEYNGL